VEKKEKKVNVNTNQKKTVVEIQSIKDAENRMKEIRKNFMKLHNQEEREDYLLTLDKISDNSKDYKDFERLSFYLLDIPIRIDVCRQMKLTHFPRNQWSRLYNTIIKINHILRESEEDDLFSNIRLFEDTTSRSDSTASNVTEQGIYISLKTYLVLIEGELKKSLTYLDSNEPEYYERLQDLIGLVNLMYKISKRIQSFDDLERDAAELAFKVLENTYFMSAALVERIQQELPEKPEFMELADEEQLEIYANLILKHSKDEESRIKTLLYIIYNHAINYREKGKELLVISTLSEVILHQDYYTQALYNRTLVQLGLAAFQSGNMFEVHQFLYEMCCGARMRESTNNVLKEYLAQGYSRILGEKDIPKAKILPAYLHLNVDLIESVELVAGMLLELPYTLTEGGRITSKTFKKFFYEYERNVTPPPRSTSSRSRSTTATSSTLPASISVRAHGRRVSTSCPSSASGLLFPEQILPVPTCSAWSKNVLPL
jgi:translation initiation factor 3 subunit C